LPVRLPTCTTAAWSIADIKPSNVDFCRGRPKLADIGLVTDVGSSQSFVGTEGFIPPEGPGTPQADLYALGKMLYELATGRDRMDFPHLPPLARGVPTPTLELPMKSAPERCPSPKRTSKR
jgi:serine/threonine protein kinase